MAAFMVVLQNINGKAFNIFNDVGEDRGNDGAIIS